MSHSEIQGILSEKKNTFLRRNLDDIKKVRSRVCSRVKVSVHVKFWNELWNELWNVLFYVV